MPKIGQSSILKPYWTTSDDKTVKLYHGHVIDVLKRLPAQSVHCCVTSPPYWGLRDYKAGEEEIGQETTPQQFVQNIVEVFREVKRVLRNDGTLWLNLGDTYDGRGLVGVPWRVALALQEDGWVLRQDIIWHKPAPMPESVKNRCTKAHEYVFLFAKQRDYYYDAEAIKEKAVGGIQERTRANGESWEETKQNNGSQTAGCLTGTINKRSVWTVASSGYPGAHFATFPPKLIEPMIKAGTSEKGCCSQCGSSYKRIVEESGRVAIEDNETKRDRSANNSNGLGSTPLNRDATIPTTKTIGWQSSCNCDAKIVPCTVLDPFMGSGTTAAVCIELGRRAVGIDLSEKYIVKNQVPRIEGVLLRRRSTAHLIRRRVKSTFIKPMKRLE